MSVLVRFTAIALAMLAVAVVVSLCGEAFACDGCAHACCMRSDRLERRREGLIARIARILGGLGGDLRPRFVLAMSRLFGDGLASLSPQLLSLQVAPLRL